jgi:hypothetical protein
MTREPVRSSFLRWLLRLFAACFTVTALGHFRAILLHGWLPYRFAPFSINAFWTALTLLDLAVAFFLLWHPRLGMLLALLIMTSDVTAVFYATRLLGSGSGFLALQRELQWPFLAVLLFSLPVIWRRSAPQPHKT